MGLRACGAAASTLVLFDLRNRMRLLLRNCSKLCLTSGTLVPKDFNGSRTYKHVMYIKLVVKYFRQSQWPWHLCDAAVFSTGREREMKVTSGMLRLSVRKTN